MSLHNLLEQYIFNLVITRMINLAKMFKIMQEIVTRI
jgi:hypothetical protein